MPLEMPVTESKNTRKISLVLEKCIKVETYTIKKYKLPANQTTNPHTKALFEMLSSEGKTHAKIIGIIREILTEQET